jgi:hypothetical protein
MTASILHPVLATFRTVAVTVVPEAASLSPEGWLELEGVVHRAIASRPAALQRQLVRFLRLVEWLPVARFGSRFSRLGADDRVRVLTKLQNAPLPAVRRGLWGLRTLVFMGYYTRPDVQAAIGYRADRRGWSARRETGEQQAGAR